MQKKDVVKALAKVVDAFPDPKENSIWMVKEVLMDMGLSCSKCGQVYQSPEEQERLGLSIVHDQTIEPEKLRVSVGCACGHLGEISLRPNPLIVV